MDNFSTDNAEHDGIVKTKVTKNREKMYLALETNTRQKEGKGDDQENVKRLCIENVLYHYRAIDYTSLSSF
jgi:hypothetical protein